MENWFTRLVLFALIVPMLVHAAHRFRYTLYDGLQVKQKVLVALALLRRRDGPVAGGVLRAGDGLTSVVSCEERQRRASATQVASVASRLGPGGPHTSTTDQVAGQSAA